MRTTKLLGLGVLFLAAACGGGGGSSSGRVQLLVTDKCFDLDLVQEALVHVTKVTLSRVDDDGEGDSQDDDNHGGDDHGGGDGGDHHGDDNGDHGQGPNTVTLYDGPGTVVNLLALRNGISTELTTGAVPPGTYRLAHLFIDDAQLTLTNGNVYSTADGTLDLTCANSSGLKIFFDPPLDVASSTDTAILLDFDLSKTFLPVPPDNPLNATKFLLVAGIRATNRTTTGDIRGTVTQDDGMGGKVGVDLATIYVLPPGETDPNNSVATTATTSDGSYAVLGLKPGTYDLLAVKDTKQGSATGVQITAAHETTQDLSIQ